MFTSSPSDRNQWKGNKPPFYIPLSSLHELHQPSSQHRVSSYIFHPAIFPVILTLITIFLVLLPQRFDLDSWGSDENDNIPGTFDSLHLQPFFFLINVLVINHVQSNNNKNVSVH